MTEAGPVLSMCLGFAKQPFPTKSGSCGTVVRNAELKVIDPDTGSSLGYNHPGEICIRGQQIMKGFFLLFVVPAGFTSFNFFEATHFVYLRPRQSSDLTSFSGYLNDPEATSNTIDADGWLHTGDIGYVDDDDEIFIVDRVKEIIKFKGFQVHMVPIDLKWTEKGCSEFLSLISRMECALRPSFQ